MAFLIDDEKIILERLRKSPYGREFIANVIDRELAEARIRVYKKEKKAFILVERNYFIGLSETEQRRIQERMRWVMYLISISFGLVEFLDECGVIKLHYADVTSDPVTIGPGDANDAHQFEITQIGVVEQLCKYIDVRVEILETIENIIN